MSLPPERFSQLRWLHNAVCVVALIGAACAIGAGVIGFTATSSTWLFVVGGAMLLVVLTLATLMPLLLKIEATLTRNLHQLHSLEESLSKQNTFLSTIAENTLISDAAKGLAHRDQELEGLRGAIRAEIKSRRWESALNLVGKMEQRFGYRDEAEALREELDEARSAAVVIKLDRMVEHIEKLLYDHDWDQASSEIDRMGMALPGNPKTQTLRDRMISLKDKRKAELRLEWDEAVRRSDTDHAIEVLRELDAYLSSSEAQELQASARDVFKEKLLQLGVQFRFAVTEKRWQDALNIGLNLVSEFPNARMANEVREALDTLRERAQQQSDHLPV